MVTRLDLKLGRDLIRLKGQAIAIAAVIAMGVMMLVMMTGLVNSLESTRQAYYQKYRLADVFVSLVRAPRSIVRQLQNLEGVKVAEGRVMGDALIDISGNQISYRAMAVSMPDFVPQKLNRVRLLAGRMPASSNYTEILLLQSFAKAHNLYVDDVVEATLFGKRQKLHIVGVAESPEFLYTTAPGEMIPAEGRFAVFWMSESAMAAAFDMDGAFNQVVMSVSKKVNLNKILFEIDAVLKPYGGLGAYGIEDHYSNRFVSEEIAGLRASSNSIPPVFMFVAAFLLYMVVGRMVQAEREQIGLLKAFGYSSLEVSWHYLKLAIVISFGGAVAGCMLGIWAGHNMTLFYQNYFKFPFIVFQLEPTAFLKGILSSVTVASLGGFWALKQVYKLTPAVAMQPPVPVDFSQTLVLPRYILAKFDQPSRMLWRRLMRQPARFISGIIGISLGMALSVAMISMLHGFEEGMKTSFGKVDRSDATVSFINSVSRTAMFELEKVNGVLAVEPFRVVPVVFRNGLYHYRGAINGYISSPDLHRPLNDKGEPLVLRQGGIILSRAVANTLNLSPGDKLTVEVKDGRRPVIQVPVSAVADTLLGAPVYMELSSLNRYLKEPNRISGAFLRLDQNLKSKVYRELKAIPKIAGVSLKQDNHDAFKKLLDSGAGAMRYVMVMIAGVISFGIVYNTASIAYSERQRELASMRVLGFHKSEANFVLLSELAVVVLVALPLGAIIGQALSHLVAEGFSTDIYQIPVVYSPRSFGIAGISVIVASVISSLMVKRQADKLDLVVALKHKE